MRARLADFRGLGTLVELGVGVTMGVALKIVLAVTGNGSEGRGGCKQAMCRACRTADDTFSCSKFQVEAEDIIHIQFAM